MAIHSIWRRAAVWLFAAIALPLILARPAHAVGSLDVVISQVYGGSGSTGVVKWDYVELYNKSDQAVDLSTWSLQYASGSASSAQTSWTVVPLSGTIQAKRYFLVAMSTATGAAGADLPTPDVTASGTGVNMGSTAGKIALLMTQTKLGTVVCPSDDTAIGAQVIDFVGFGSTAKCSETSPAPAPSVTTAILRNGDPRGSIDTDNNSTDFTAGTPDPRNSAWTPNATTPPTVSDVTFNPASALIGTAGVSITSTVTPGTNGNIATVTADLSPFGGGTVNLANTTGSTYAGTFSVPANAAGGTYTITVTATDNGATPKTGKADGSFTVLTTAPPLTVAETRQQPSGASVKVRGIVTDVTTGNAYIQDADSISPAGGITVYDGQSTIDATQIKDAGGNPQNLQLGQDITFTATTGTYGNELELISPANLEVNAPSATLPAIKTVTVPQVTGNDTYEGQLIDLGNLTVVSVPGTTTTTSTSGAVTFTVQDASGNQIAIYLHRNATTAANTPWPGIPGTTGAADPNPAVEASVDGSGVISYPNIQIGQIYHVKGILAERTSPTPVKLVRVRDAADFSYVGMALISNTVANPAIVERGGSVNLAVTTNPASGSTVTVDLSSIGGPTSLALTDNGMGAYAADYTVPSNAPLGPATLPVHATNGTNSQVGQIALTIVTPVQTLTIAQARAVPDYTQVQITGNVTATTTGANQIYLQDSTGGVYIFSATGGFLANIGDSVTATGIKKTYSGSVEIDYTNSGIPTANAGTVVTPKSVKVAEWPDNPGMLVSNSSLYIVNTVSGAGSGNNAYTVTDGTSFGELFLHKNTAIPAANLPVVGQSYNVTGISDFFDGSRTAWQLKPRDASDIVTGAAPAAIPTKVAFTAAPANAMPGAAFGTQPVVTVQDASGNTVSAFTGPVTVSIKSGTGTSGAVLSGTTTVNAVNGVATFSGLSIDKAGEGYILTATAGPLSVESAAFTVGAVAKPGDINKDNVVNDDDVRLALKIAGGLVAGNDPSVSITNGDVFPKGSPDGNITLDDALRILRSINGKDTL